MSTTTWDAVLDQLTIELDTIEASLDESDSLESFESDFTPPSGLGPLPPHLQPRARALVARQVEVEQRLATTMRLTGTKVAEAGRQQRTVSQYSDTKPSAYIDRAV